MNLPFGPFFRMGLCLVELLFTCAERLGKRLGFRIPEATSRIGAAIQCSILFPFFVVPAIAPFLIVNMLLGMADHKVIIGNVPKTIAGTAILGALFGFVFYSPSTRSTGPSESLRADSKLK
jgi:hypothetical protein